MPQICAAVGRHLDFGIARVADDTRMTKTGNTIGTFAYIAPERLDGIELPPLTIGITVQNRDAAIAMAHNVSDIVVLEAEHGPPEARRYTYEPTWQMRGLIELHLGFTPI